MPDPVLPADPTLDELRVALAPAVARNAGFDGWTPAAIDAAAAAAGVDPAVARLAFPGPVAMIDAWFADVDARMLAATATALPALKVRARIAALVEARLDLLAPDREGLRRALSVLALPPHVAAAARLGWRAADAMWRAAGDTATDYNHYTKRAILAAVYGATIAVFLDDDSEDQVATRGFLARRIDGIMRFERAKAGFVARTADRPSLARFVGRLRYPAV